jgi:hypothetical protein
MYSIKDIPYHVQEKIKATEVETSLSQRAKSRQGKPFLKGPIPMGHIATAARLPGKCLALFLAIHHQIALTRNRNATIKASPKLLGNLGISRSTKARCLKLLERAGLIIVTRSRGAAVRIQLNQIIGENYV